MSTLAAPSFIPAMPASILPLAISFAAFQLALAFLLMRHIDARLSALSRQTDRVDLVSPDDIPSHSASRGSSCCDRSQWPNDEEDEEDETAGVVIPFTTSPIDMSTRDVTYPTVLTSGSDTAQRGYDIRQRGLQLHVDAAQTCLFPTHGAPSCSATRHSPSSSDSPRIPAHAREHATFYHLPTPIALYRPSSSQSAYTFGSPSTYGNRYGSGNGYERPALSRSQSHSTPRPYSSYRPSSSSPSSYTPSPLSRQCSLPNAPAPSHSSSYSHSQPTCSSSSSNLSSSRSFQCDNSDTPRYPTSASCPVSPADRNTTDGPAMYTNAKISFRRHKDAYASLPYEREGDRPRVRGRGRGRTEWVDLPPMYDEVAWSPINGAGGRSATL